jgi:hypothetical protein
MRTVATAPNALQAEARFTHHASRAAQRSH